MTAAKSESGICSLPGRTASSLAVCNPRYVPGSRLSFPAGLAGFAKTLDAIMKTIWRGGPAPVTPW